MDVDYWTSKILSDKHLSSSHFNSENHLILVDSDANEEDTRSYVACPFCYFEIDLSVLGAHLEDEHCFDDKNTVCPVCALNMGKDIVGHFRVHHANSLKKRRKSQKSTFWSPNVRELSSFYGFSRTGGSIDHVLPDPVFAPFLSKTPNSELKADGVLDTCSSNSSTSLKTESSKTTAPSDGQEKDYTERMQRAEFLQELIVSAIF